MDADSLKVLIDLGGQGILLYLLYLVWSRLNDVTDRLIDIADEVRLNRVESITAKGAEPKPNLNP